MAAGTGGFSSALSLGLNSAYAAMKTSGQAERVAVGSGKEKAQKSEGPDQAGAMSANSCSANCHEALPATSPSFGRREALPGEPIADYRLRSQYRKLWEASKPNTGNAREQSVAHVRNGRGGFQEAGRGRSITLSRMQRTGEHAESNIKLTPQQKTSTELVRAHSHPWRAGTPLGKVDGQQSSALAGFSPEDRLGHAITNDLRTRANPEAKATSYLLSPEGIFALDGASIKPRFVADIDYLYD